MREHEGDGGDMPRQLTSREEILDSSAAVAKEHGLDAISIRGVAAARGVATGTIYNYFPSRDELVAATAERLFGDHRLERVRGDVCEGDD